MLIAVGSTNRVKVAAVKNALIEEEVAIIPCSASSKVRDQPLSAEETLQGAVNRARECLEKIEADLAIGLEGGIEFIQEKVYLCHWGALVDREQSTYITNSPLFLLPAIYQGDLQAGKNLDEVMLHFTGIENLGSKQGAIGYFTENRLTREEVLAHMVKVLYGQYCYYAQSCSASRIRK